MSRPLVRTIVVIAVVAAGGLAIYLATRPDPIEVEVRAAAIGTVEATVANTRAGTVKARRRAGLAPAIPGTVVELPVKEGDRVETGQLLLRLWSSDLEAELALARGEARQARALHEQAIARAAHAKRDAERLTELREDGIASDEEVDAATSLQAELEAAQRAAAAAIEVREARATTVAARIEQTQLRAPFAGIIAEVNAELGEFVTPSPIGIPTPPSIDLIDRESLYVTAPIDEVDAPAVRPGMPVRVTLDALRNETFTGRVDRIAPYVLDVEKQARTVDVEVAFDDSTAAARLLPGYSADVELVLDRRDDTLRIPTEAIADDGRVLVFDPDAGTLRATTIEIGLANWTFTEVVSGLTRGDLVVVSRDRAGVVDGAEAVVAPQDATR